MEKTIHAHELWKNNKTGNVYGIIVEAITSTNANAGQHSVIYTAYDDNFQRYIEDDILIDEVVVFSREKEEFLKKFTKMN